MSTATLEPGLPVEIGKIDRELGKLWEDSGDTKTRASLINLAIYTENAEQVVANTELISQIATEHACRALLIYANREADESEAKAWISAHCHLAGKGERQVCSEQITFQLDGDTVDSLPSIVFSHLDSDLPLCFWWQGEFRAQLDRELWSWIDRLIFDSADWENPADQFKLVHEIEALDGGRTMVCDLNWTRLLGTRFALAQLFDHSCVLSRLREIRGVTIATNHRTTGLLLLGWIAAQSKWKHQTLMGKEFFLTPEGEHVEFVIDVVPGADISLCRFECGKSSFEISREAGSDYFHAKLSGTEACETPMLISAGKSQLADILVMVLSRGLKHPMYTKALAAIEPLF